MIYREPERKRNVLGFLNNAWRPGQLALAYSDELELRFQSLPEGDSDFNRTVIGGLIPVLPEGTKCGFGRLRPDEYLKGRALSRYG